MSGTQAIADYQLGRPGEMRAARELRRAGWWVIPRYESSQEGRAPVLYGPTTSRALPDLEAFHPDGGGHAWVEVKSKSDVALRRTEQGRPYTGIDVHSLQAYEDVQNLTRARVWLLTYAGDRTALWMPLTKALQLHRSGGSWWSPGSPLVSWPLDTWEAVPMPDALRWPGRAQTPWRTA